MATSKGSSRWFGCSGIKDEKLGFFVSASSPPRVHSVLTVFEISNRFFVLFRDFPQFLDSIPFDSPVFGDGIEPQERMVGPSRVGRNVQVLSSQKKQRSVKVTFVGLHRSTVGVVHRSSELPNERVWERERERERKRERERERERPADTRTHADLSGLVLFSLPR